MVELAGGDESALSRQLAWRRLGVEGLDLFRHPEIGSDRDGLVIGYRGARAERMVGSFGRPGPASALTHPAQLAPSRRTQVAHDQCDTAVSVESMLAVGNIKITDLLCVTPPPIPEGAHAMTQLVELPRWSRFLAVCICAPGVDMITRLEPQELDSRDSLRHPSARRQAQ